MQKAIYSLVLGIGLLLTGLAPSHAQATRTWVSGVGDDANPCSRTAPCKTFAGAISKTAVNGEISVLDPGGFGAVTITKSLSIVADGSEGSMTACGITGININGAGIIVHLSGLYLEGCGTGLNGIRILAAQSVHIRKCVIRGFRGSGANGISIVPSAGNVKVVVSECEISDNRNGVVSDASGTGNVEGVLDRVVVTNNMNRGVRVLNNKNNLTLSNSVITGNDTGLDSAGGAIISLGNNVIRNNTTNGAPTSTVSPE